MRASRTVSGSFEAPTTLPGEPASGPAVALSRGGTAIIAWSVLLPGGTSVLMASSRERSGSWGKAADVGIGQAPVAAVNDRGDAVVAWALGSDEGPQSIESAARRGDGEWSAGTVIARRGCECALAVGTAAIDARGLAAVSWRRLDRGRPGVGGGPRWPPVAAPGSGRPRAGGARRRPGSRRDRARSWRRGPSPARPAACSPARLRGRGQPGDRCGWIRRPLLMRYPLVRDGEEIDDDDDRAAHRGALAPGPARDGGPGLPRGRPMVVRAIQGVGLDDGDRVVEMAPGLGITSAIVLERNPRTWVGVEPDPIAREHLERALGGSGRRVLDAPPAASGLEDESASVVIVNALLSTLDGDGRAAVLAEAARLLRSGGRCTSSRRRGTTPPPRTRSPGSG